MFCLPYCSSKFPLTLIHHTPSWKTLPSFLDNFDIPKRWASGLLRQILPLWIIFKFLYLIWDICTCATYDYSFIHTIYTFHDMESNGNLHWRYPLIKWLYTWRHEGGHMNSHENTFCCATSSLKYQPLHKLLSWHLNKTNMVKGQCITYWTERIFRKIHVITVLLQDFRNHFPDFHWF